MQTRARIGFAVLALAVAGGLVLGFHPPAVPVEMAAVTRGPLVVTVEEEGKTRVRDRFVVSAPIAGYVRRIELRAGESVRTGQALAVIEPSRASALDPRVAGAGGGAGEGRRGGRGGARENARAAAAQAELARQELERTESLRRSNFVSEQALDRARSEVDPQPGGEARGRPRGDRRPVRARRCAGGARQDRRACRRGRAAKRSPCARRSTRGF